MSKKRSTKGKRQKGGQSRQTQPTKVLPQQRSWRHHLTPIKLGLGLGIVTLGLALLWGSLRPERADSALGQDALPPAPPGTKAPINDVDPLTGKPITPSSPTTVYKGYVVAFCCAESSAYSGGWARMSETAKDAFVRRCLE